MRAELPSEKKCIALIGECLIELNGEPFGSLHQTFGGDTLNTALYLARLTRPTIDVKYVTAVGTDALSNGMVQRWQAEGIDTALTLRDPARPPGLYLIQVDAHGERTFLYWRGESAARIPASATPSFAQLMIHRAEAGIALTARP